ncbi:histidine--tRNA ligase [Temperatibacter marinus]|uniref:Histidine--tRNA ligase n=1 Tax=Temperatibacter marinus TaxID=1456591 RepID=A0AA52EFI2_9PROT|nr:histidine--tRNA ligase [Temperatibacter marinus]WND01379.1 histidine--tRNA ligase [Temperatibacter marinus]
MSKLQPARGTRDIYGEDARRFQKVIDTFTAVGTSYGFESISTPIFEFTEVFKRPLGETSDVVSKEMYTFEDRGGEEVTLRPELTASICRSFISNGMMQNLPCRFMSWGPAFRYERPQKGRYRQFHQIDAELIGPAEPEADVDVIAMAYRILVTLGFADRVKLNLNTLGDSESREAYRQELVTYFTAYKDQLSEDSQRRLETNPLRILDSKDEADQKLVVDAPRFSDSLNEASVDFFNRVQAGLTAAGVPFDVNERLVRGLDYYCHTAFEFITESLGAQGTVLAGGRYDGLIAQLGGQPTAGIGWAGGIERLAMMLDETPHAPRPVVMVPMGEAATVKAISVAEKLRDAGFTVTSDRSGNMKKRMNRANKAHASFGIIIGDNELENHVAMVKNLDEGTQEEVAFDQIADFIKRANS